MSTPSFPCLPLICLESARDLTTHDILKGQTTVIDFWTTRCTRCPAALDNLNSLAQDERFCNIKFVSICCDKLDGARNIIERDRELKWSSVNHYFMSEQVKEKAKLILGFSSVPFYVVLDAKGEIVQLGNKIDFEAIPGVNKENEPEQPLFLDVPKENILTPRLDQEFVLEELDF